MSYFSIGDGLKYEFEKRFNNESHGKDDLDLTEYRDEFPVNKSDLVSKYVNMERVLNQKWHSKTNLGAAVNDGGLLTDHGVRHINQVMYHAMGILGQKTVYLSGYEIYLLLLSIHFHDLGNIHGRENHEEKIQQVMSEMGSSLELDRVEQEFVSAIARAHGGNIDGDKDTIRFVNVDETCNGITIRSKILAAILRFADELSDDFHRSDYDEIDIPKENQVFHEYSKALDPISITGDTVKYHFRVPYVLTQSKVGKGSEEVFLYDEICERLAKSMRELEYCKRYANGFIGINTFDVKIDIIGKNERGANVQKERITFRLSILGYPSENKTSINDYLVLDDQTDGTKPSGLKYTTGDALKTAMEGKNGQ